MNKRTEQINEMRRRLSLWVVPVVGAVVLPAHAQTSEYIPPEPPEEKCPDEWTKSSFTFTDDNVICNHGKGPSLCPIEYIILSRIPGSGRPIFETAEEGIIDPLGIDGCYDFSDHVIDLDRYCIIVYQDEGHPGKGEVKYCNESGD